MRRHGESNKGCPQHLTPSIRAICTADSLQSNDKDALAVVARRHPRSRTEDKKRKRFRTMKALVTGSSGLLGHCLTEVLNKRNDQVIGFDMVAGENQGINFLQGDMRDAEAVKDAARNADVIYHLAAGQRMKPQFSGLGEEEIYDMNLGGVANVIKAADDLGTKKIVFISSSGIYGVPQTLPCTEQHPTLPLGAYGDSKIEAEHLCRQAIERGMDITVLRPMSLFGPRMTGVFAILYEWVRTNQFVFTLGSGKNRVQMVSAWDVSEACVCAAEANSDVRFFNIGSNPEEVPSVADQVRALITHAGSGSTVIPIPAGLLRTAARALDLIKMSPIVPEHYILADTNFVLDIDLARKHLGWQPKRNNVQLMTEAYDWYVENLDRVRAAPHPVLRLLSLFSLGRTK